MDSNLSSINQKLAEQASQNAQYEAGQPNPNDVAQFEQAVNQTPATTDTNATRSVPGPADIQFSDTSAGKIDSLVDNATTNIQNQPYLESIQKNGDPDFYKQAKELQDGTIEQINAFNDRLSNIKNNPNLNPEQAKQETEAVSNDFLKYLQDSSDRYTNLKTSLNDQILNVTNNGQTSPAELLKLQHTMSQFTLMTDTFSKTAGKITDGIKTILQQQ